MYRRLLHEQMRIVEDGGDPMNVIRDPAKNVNIVTPYEAIEGTDTRFRGAPRPAGAISTGNSGKYSPLNRERAKKAGLPVSEIPESAPNMAQAGTTL